MLTMIALYMHAKWVDRLDDDTTMRGSVYKTSFGERCWYAGGGDDDKAARAGSGRRDRAGAGGGGVLRRRARDHPGQRGWPCRSDSERGRHHLGDRGGGAA